MATEVATMTDPSDERTHSDSDLETIIDLVMYRDMPQLSARGLIQLHCNGWPVWEPYTVERIAQARRLDDTGDWYFPIIVPKRHAFEQEDSFGENSGQNWGGQVQVPEEISGQNWAGEVGELRKLLWSMSGIWHSTSRHATQRLLPLPSMAILPLEWLYYSLPRGDIIASAGGLLLIKSVEGVVPLRRSHRLNPRLQAQAQSNRVPAISDVFRVPSNLLCPPRWKRLLVCNPLTKQCKELPAANCQLIGLESFAYSKGVQVMFDVDDKANTYRVILTLERFVAVYTSTSNAWQCLRFQEDRPWARIPRNRPPGAWGFHCASALVRKHLYFGEIEPITDAGMGPIERPTPAATLKLFEVDTESGRWNCVQDYTILKFHMPDANRTRDDFLFCMRVNPFMEFVECAGALYAVIPAKLHDALLIGNRPSFEWSAEVYYCGDPSELDYMPLCFYIIRLQDDGVDDAVDCGVLLIQVPRARHDFENRQKPLKCLATNCCWFGDKWFSCSARGGVIWVSCKDYLLSYDLVSHESTTEIMPVNLRAQDALQFSYRPSFHMQP